MGLVQDWFIFHSFSLNGSLKPFDDYETLDAQYESDEGNDEFFRYWQTFSHCRRKKWERKWLKIRQPMGIVVPKGCSLSPVKALQMHSLSLHDIKIPWFWFVC